MIHCSTCDKTFSPKGIKNHEQACSGKNKTIATPSTFGDAFQILLRMLSHIKLSWLIPEWNILSLIYYCLIVYPVGYIIVFRLLLSPAWDIVNAIWKIGEASAQMYDALGLTPDSILRSKEPLEAGPAGYFWSFLVKGAKFIQDFNDANK